MKSHLRKEMLLNDTPYGLRVMTNNEQKSQPNPAPKQENVGREEHRKVQPTFTKSHMERSSKKKSKAFQKRQNGDTKTRIPKRDSNITRKHVRFIEKRTKRHNKYIQKTISKKKISNISNITKDIYKSEKPKVVKKRDLSFQDSQIFNDFSTKNTNFLYKKNFIGKTSYQNMPYYNYHNQWTPLFKWHGIERPYSNARNWAPVNRYTKQPYMANGMSDGVPVVSYKNSRIWPPVMRYFNEFPAATNVKIGLPVLDSTSYKLPIGIPVEPIVNNNLEKLHQVSNEQSEVGIPAVGLSSMNSRFGPPAENYSTDISMTGLPGEVRGTQSDTYSSMVGLPVQDNTPKSSYRQSNNVKLNLSDESQFTGAKRTKHRYLANFEELQQKLTHAKCFSLHKHSMYNSIWMGANPDWAALQLHLGIDPDQALKQARKSLDHYRTKLNDLWNIHGLTAGSGHGLDGQPWCTSHYTFHMMLWHIPLAMTGQQYSIIDRTLSFVPKLKVPYSLPFFVPYASGTIEAILTDDVTSFKVTVTHGYLVLKELSISGVTWPGRALKLEKGENVIWSSQTS